MNWNNHSNLEGAHALLSPSKFYWVNYDDEKAVAMYNSSKAAEIGTRLHALASEHIKLGIKMPKNNQTLSMFVNDAIGFRMKSEQILYYSEFCFGTADAISFKKDILRIFDYKSGTTVAKKEQLLIYDALFCLEYDIRPGDIEHDLRIYQNDEIVYYETQANDILPIMDKIIRFDKLMLEQALKEV